MRIGELFESAERDLESLRYAEGIVSKLAHYLMQKNETVPLKDCGFLYRQSGPDDLWLFPATDAGVAQPDLWFGVGWRARAADSITAAYATTGRNADGPLIYLMMLLDHDPSDETNVVHHFKWEHLIHEMRHILDYRRGYLRHRQNVARAASKRGMLPSKLTGAAYYNSPIEFNGFYTQGLYNIRKMLSRADLLASPIYQWAFRRDTLDSFAHFYAAFEHEFDAVWMAQMTPTNKRRFLRRLSKLYALVRAEWPNIGHLR